MRSHISSSTALAFSSVFLTTTYGHALCYYPNGDSIATDIPSNVTSSNGYASCCGAGANYYSSGLCIVDGIISRGSCTDQSYSDDACASYCRNVNPTGGIVIVPVGTATTWCCGFTDSNGTCDTANSIINFKPGNIVNEVISTTSTSSSATSTPTPSAATTGISTSTTSAASDSASSSSCSNSSEVAVGAGVGIPLGLALMGVLGLFFRERRKNQFREAPYPGYPGAPIHEMYGKRDYPSEQDWASHTHAPPPMPIHGGNPNTDHKSPFGNSQRSELST